ncbi:MAG: hypothetical protein DKINENOH_04828 [bacterium]|nr:hypothetical protein [bacterium]
MRYLCEIELLSAAMPGSGAGWGGVIDSDVVFDEYGLPFIPARRLKGILREMSGDLIAALRACLDGQLPFEEGMIGRLFGKAGQANSAPLEVGNAYLENYAGLRDWLIWAQHEAPRLVTADRVIATFTHWRQQTAIDPDKGVALENSLRITRVLNRGCKFFSEIILAGSDPGQVELLALAAQVTRRLGSKRNRGLGNVKCRLLEGTSQRDLSREALARWQPRLGGQAQAAGAQISTGRGGKP